VLVSVLPRVWGQPLPAIVAPRSRSTARMIRRASGKNLTGASASASAAAPKARETKMPRLEDFVSRCDWTGALTLLDFHRRSGDETEDTLPWIAYCAYHLGDFRKALETYTEIEEVSVQTERCGSSHSALQMVGKSAMTCLGRACCHYFVGDYTAAVAAARESPEDSPLKNRVMFHCAHKLGDEDLLVACHDRLRSTKFDQLSLAAVHYLRSHYQEATDIYKRLNYENPDDLALHMYMAMCYYKLDYYDVSLKILNVYLQHAPHSPAALNLKACNHFRLYNGKAAEAELRALVDVSGDSSVIEESAALKHNMVVFRGGVDAARVLPPLLGIVPEARINLVVYFLKTGEIAEAYRVIRDVEPSVPVEYIVKAVVHAEMGQASGDREQLRHAQQYFQLGK
jgi:intraflagellar transport protein 56